MKPIRAALIATLMVSAASAATLTENFDNISTLAGSGWVATNRSSPVGVTGWFQGNAGVFNAFSGAPNSYIAANFLNADVPSGAISNWLITPLLTLQNGNSLTFYTRTDEPGFQDSLEVRFNPLGTTNVGSTASSTGDFSQLLLSINPLLNGSYPGDWTRQTAIVTGAPTPVQGRFAFRYVVADTTANGSYIGIDSVTIDAVPEPGTLGLAACSLVLTAAWLRRRAV